MKLVRRSIAPSMLVFFLFALLRFGDAAADAVQAGLSLCCHSVLPSLFPFFVASSLLVSLGFAEYLGKWLEPIIRPVFRIGGAGAMALILGFVGGYPAGARAALDLYRQDALTKAETQRLLCFCNNTGPGFILGVVGSGVFHDARIGVYLYLIHILSALSVGCLLRKSGAEKAHPIPRRAEIAPFSRAFTEAIQSAFSSALNVCAFVVFFLVVLRLLECADVLALPEAFFVSLFGGEAAAVLRGCVEMTNGIVRLSATRGGFAAAAFLLGWGGLSVHAQTLSLLSATDLDTRRYLIAKALQGIISVPLALLVSKMLF